MAVGTVGRRRVPLVPAGDLGRLSDGASMAVSHEIPGNGYPLRSEYEVEEALVYAVICCESSFKPDAVSDAGAIGLMQITEETFDWIKSGIGSEAAEDVYEDLFEPDKAIQYGTYLLSRLLSEFGSEKNAWRRITPDGAKSKTGWQMRLTVKTERIFIQFPEMQRTPM